MGGPVAAWFHLWLINPSTSPEVTFPQNPRGMWQSAQHSSRVKGDERSHVSRSNTSIRSAAFSKRQVQVVRSRAIRSQSDSKQMLTLS